MLGWRRESAPIGRFPDGTAPRVAILGAGVSGLCMGIQLKRAGLNDFRIFEKSDGVGGTWRDNHYPGSGCDVPSHLYSFSFEHKTDWSRRFAAQPEILEYFEACADKYGLREHIAFGTEVESCRFDAKAGMWCVRTTGAEEYDAHVLVSGTGQLNRPHLPRIEGANDFEGTVFHSARWNHQHDLTGENVAVIGNGASAVQFVPEIAPQVRQLHIFQRSPNWIVPKPDREYTERDRRRFANPIFARLYRYLLYWSLEIRFAAFKKENRVARWLRGMAASQLEEQVDDPALLPHLLPDYPVGCKRILISNDYYPALERPNVEVVTNAVLHFTKDGIVTDDGRERPIDTVIFGTGFETTSFLAPIRIETSTGETLEQRWQDGAEAHLGVAVAGFPNFYMLYGPNTNLGHNSIIFMVECQVNYVMKCVRRLVGEGLRALDVSQPAMDRYNEEVQRNANESVWGGSCDSWYKTADGKITNNWPDWTVRYWWRTRRPAKNEFRALAGR